MFKACIQASPIERPGFLLQKILTKNLRKVSVVPYRIFFGHFFYLVC